MVAAPSYIDVDEKGIAWIDGTTTKVREVIVEYIAYGHSVAEIHFQHPYLSLAHIHAAFAYYYSHQEAAEAKIEEDHNLAMAERERAGMSPFAQRLSGLVHGTEPGSAIAKVSWTLRDSRRDWFTVGDIAQRSSLTRGDVKSVILSHPEMFRTSRIMGETVYQFRDVGEGQAVAV